MRKAIVMKDQFLLNPTINYLNHGSFGACPKEVFEKYQSYQTMLEADSVQFMTKVGPSLMDVSKKALADFIHCEEEDLIFVTNPSTAMNTIIKSLDLQEGDEVLTTNQEYGAVDRTWNFLMKKKGIKYVRANIQLPLISKEQFLADFWSGLTAKTKVVCLSEITSHTALIFPVKEICVKAKELGLITIIDGAHVPGHTPLNLSDLDPDFYTGACHKWMLTPKGCSFMYARKNMQHLLDPLIVSWGYEAQYPSESQYQDYHQYQGTRDFSAFLTVKDCLDWMDQNNWKDKTAKSKQMLRHFYPIVAKELNSSTLCPISEEFLGQICSFPIQTSDPHTLKEVLFNEYKIEIPIMNNVGPVIYTRISFQPYVTEADIEDFISAIRSIQQNTNLLS